MSKPRGGLGRGLGALIPTAPPVPATPAESGGAAVGTGAVVADGHADQLAPVPGARFAEIPVDSIVPNPKQPRQNFDEGAFEELKQSIDAVGFLQPIVVRETGTDKFELVMGERRWRAAQAIGRELIPAIVRETRDDAMLRDALLENIHRANLNPLEEAAAYQQLLDRVRRHPRRARPPDRPQPAADLQHDPAVEPAGRRAAPCRRRRPLRRPCPCAVVAR